MTQATTTATTTTTMLWIVIALLLVLFPVACKYCYRIYFSPLCVFPGPRWAACSRLFEAYHMLVLDDWYEELQHLHSQYGPVVRIGPNELHFTDAQFCLSYHGRTDLAKCPSYYGILGDLVGGLAGAAEHRARKYAVQPLFSGQALADFSRSALDRHIEALLGLLAAVARRGDAVNVTHLLWAYASEIMASYVLADEGLELLGQADLEAWHGSARPLGAAHMATMLRSIPFFKSALDVLPALRRLSPVAWIDELIGTHFDSIVREDRVGGALSSLWSRLSDRRLVADEMAQAVLIGNESLLSNMTAVLHNLIRNPECIRKIRAELDTLDRGIYGHRVWRDPDVMRLRYLDAVCRESMRMSAPGWHRQPRQLPQSIDYQGKTIPSTTSLSFTVRMLEHDPSLYRDPQVFNPERWLGDSDDACMARRSSVTFGTGSRTCLGQHLARHVLRKTTAALVYNFDMSFSSKIPDAIQGAKEFHSFPKKGSEGYLWLRLTPRFDNQ